MKVNCLNRVRGFFKVKPNQMFYNGRLLCDSALHFAKHMLRDSPAGLSRVAKQPSVTEKPAGIFRNGFGLCVRWGFPALKPNSSTNFNLSTND